VLGLIPTSTPAPTSTSTLTATNKPPITPLLSITTTGTIGPEVMVEPVKEELVVAQTSPSASLYLPLLLYDTEATPTAQNEGNSTQITDETAKIELQKVQLMLNEATAKYHSQLAQAESEMELSRLRATQTVQALGSPLPVETAVAQQLMAEQKHTQSCLFPTPDPAQLIILQKEIDLAELSWRKLVLPPTVPVSPGQDMLTLSQIQLEVEHAAAHYESERAQAKAIFDLAAAQATATVQALQPTPLLVTPISLSEAAMLLETAKKEERQRCTPATPDADALFFAQREVELAQLRLLAVLTPTAAPLPAPTVASSRITTTMNAEDSTRIYSPVAGQVQQIEVIKADGRYVTIRIVIALANGEQTSCVHLPKGAPGGLPSSNHFICRDIYALSANIERKFADFVAYCITPESINGPSEQSREWMADPDLPSDITLEPEDYRGANQALGTDRGHLAPLASFRGANWQQTNRFAYPTSYRKNPPLIVAHGKS